MWRGIAGAVALTLAAPAGAQLLGVPLPELPLAGGLVRGADEALGDVTRLASRRLDDLARLVRANPRVLDTDDTGAPIVRGEVLAVSPSAAALDAARAAGFEVRRTESVDDLGLTLVTLAAPEGPSTRRAIKRLRQLDPGGVYDFNHIYSGAGTPPGPPAAATGPAVRVGLIDGGVATGHPALAGVTIEQRGFAPGGVAPRAHGTAVASRLVGRGGTLLAADVYGTGPTGGSAEAVARALGWMAREGVGVVNVSLVGPPNAMLAAAVKALHARGHLVVAAVGNDGPAAKPLYPASYLEVVAVTGVDARHRVLVEASRSPSLDFAAPGVASAATDAGGYAPVRGTSFAAPIVAARLAMRLPRPDPTRATQAVSALAAEAVDLGKPGYDKLYGHGLVDLGPRPALAAKNRDSSD